MEKNYRSTSVASKILGLKPTTIGYRLSSTNFPNYMRLSDSKAKTQIRKDGYSPITVSVDNKIYKSIYQASKILKMSRTTIKARIKSDDFPNYKLVEEDTE